MIPFCSIKSQITKLIYPVGSIYMSVKDTNPSELFGGTWVAWGSGRVPIGVNVNDADFSTVEKMGGNKTITLTTAQLPVHNHTFTGSPHSHGVGTLTTSNTGSHYHELIDGAKKPRTWASMNDGGTGHDMAQTSGTRTYSILNQNTSATGNHTHTISGSTATVTQGGSIGNTGSGSSINIVQQYITCYMWKRTS